MAKADKAWERFEDAFRAIIDQHKDFFGLESIEPGKSKAPTASGYVYDVEVMAYRKGDRRFVLFECHRKRRNLEPGDAGEFAYWIERTGAGSGYFVTKLGKRLSKGAQLLADYERIGHNQLSENATPLDYVMKFMNDTFVGVSSGIIFSHSFDYEVLDTDGNQIVKGTGK